MKLSTIFLVVLGSLWTLAVVVGLSILTNYDTTPGKEANPPVAWPGSSKISLANDRATLIMIAHPQCPCTRTSIEELAQLIDKRPQKLKAYVLCLSPKKVPAEWQERTDLRHNAETIPGVTVINDTDGSEAKRFNAFTSGQTIIYNTDGKLLFAGGITTSRGKLGDDSTRDSIISILDQQPLQPKFSIVFGCPLNSPENR